jgi:hypothetical protein
MFPLSSGHSYATTFAIAPIATLLTEYIWGAGRDLAISRHNADLFALKVYMPIEQIWFCFRRVFLFIPN